MLKKRRGGNQGDNLVLRFPTPECIYPFHPMEADSPNKCVNGCPRQYCLQDICMTKVMSDTHFPTSRPVSVPVSFADRNVSFKSR